MGQFFYGGVVWTMDDISPIVTALHADRDEIPRFTDKMIEGARGCFGWGQYAIARDWFDTLTRVLEALDRLGK